LREKDQEWKGKEGLIYEEQMNPEFERKRSNVESVQASYTSVLDGKDRMLGRRRKKIYK